MEAIAAVPVPVKPPRYNRLRGRPKVDKLPIALKTKLIDAIREGNYIQTAMTLIGLPTDFYEDCLLQASRGNAYFKDFTRDLQKAEAEAEVTLTKRMLNGGKDFLPCATMLERRFRERYGRSEKRQVEVSGEVTISVVNYAELARTVRGEKIISPRKRKIK